MKADEKAPRYATALHEAGHVFLAYHFGFIHIKATINKKDPTRGMTYYFYKNSNAIRNYGLALLDIAMSYGGHVAPKAMRNSWYNIDELEGDSIEIDKVCKRHRVHAKERRLMERLAENVIRRNLPTVKRIAKALAAKGMLGDRRIRSIIGKRKRR